MIALTIQIFNVMMTLKFQMMILKFEMVILISHIVSLGKCLYVCDCFSAVNRIVIGIVISHMVPLGKCLYVCELFSAVNRIMISHMVPLGKCLYVCEFFSAMNGIIIRIVNSQMVSLGKCLYVCDSFSAMNILAIGIVILGNVWSAQYLMNNFWSTCNCDCLWLLNVIVFTICNALCLCEYPLNQISSASTFSFALNESVTGFHAFCSLFERVICLYPFSSLCWSVMDYALKFTSYTGNSIMRGISDIQW